MNPQAEQEILRICAECAHTPYENKLIYDALTELATPLLEKIEQLEKQLKRYAEILNLIKHITKDK